MKKLVAAVAGMLTAVATVLVGGPAQGAPVVIQVENEAGPFFGVALDGAIQNWNRNGRILLVRVPACDLGANCVHVGWASAFDHLGWTDRVGPRDWRISVNAVAWADAHDWNPAGVIHLRRALMCHELGHILLGTPQHFETGNGCMDVDVDEGRRFAGPMLLAAVATGTIPDVP